MNQRVHYARAEQLERHLHRIGIAALLLSTLVGTSSLLAVLKESVAPWARIALGVISYVAAALAGLQAYFKFSERAMQHHAVAGKVLLGQESGCLLYVLLAVTVLVLSKSRYHVAQAIAD
jgi:hypothetical protein